MQKPQNSPLPLIANFWLRVCQQHHWDRFCNFQKNTFLRFYVSTDLGGCISVLQHPLTKFLCCGKIVSQRCYYSCRKMSWLKIKKLPTACFCEGRLRLFEMEKGAQDDFDDMPSTVSKYISCRPTNIFNLSFIKVLSF